MAWHFGVGESLVQTIEALGLLKAVDLAGDVSRETADDLLRVPVGFPAI